VDQQGQDIRDLSSRIDVHFDAQEEKLTQILDRLPKQGGVKYSMPIRQQIAALPQQSQSKE
jgi:hypothetical protein